MFSLKGKIALVTGAGSGIGASIAQVLARAGARVFITDIQEAGARQTCDAIEKAGGAAEAFQLNVAEEEPVNSLAAQLEEKHGPLDILVPPTFTPRPESLTFKADPSRFLTIADNMRLLLWKEI